jgi:hypothetical protein
MAGFSVVGGWKFRIGDVLQLFVSKKGYVLRWTLTEHSHVSFASSLNEGVAFYHRFTDVGVTYKGVVCYT